MRTELTSYIDNKKNIWLTFRGKDIAKIPSHNDTDQALRKHVDSEYKKTYHVVSMGLAGMQF